MGIQASNIIVTGKAQSKPHVPIVEKVQPKQEEQAPVSVSGQVRAAIKQKYAQPEPRIKRRAKLTDPKPRQTSTYIDDMTEHYTTYK